MKDGTVGQPLPYRGLMRMVMTGVVVLGILLIVLILLSWPTGDSIQWRDGDPMPLDTLEERYRQLAESITPEVALTEQQVAGLEEIARILQTLSEQEGHFNSQTPGRLRDIANSLQVSDPNLLQQRFPESMRLLAETLWKEVAVRQMILQDFDRHTDRQRYLLLGLGLLPLLLMVFWLLIRRKLMRPTSNLIQVMELLACRDYRTVNADRFDPDLRPVFDNYNRIVSRIQDLEAGHVERESALREELKRATGALLQQQSILNREDTLASLGEVAARMAHRLRNPLSGVLVTLTNLIEETHSSDHRQRLRFAIEALLRSFSELTELVNEASQEPEAWDDLVLSPVVSELFSLIRLQTGEDKIVLENAVSPELACRLPETGLRHALMKLLLNAVEAQRSVDHGFIRVAAEREDNALRIAVQYGGPGFTETELESARSGDNPLNHIGHTGGLSVVRRFIEQLEGRLLLDCPDEGGARIIMIVPQEKRYD